MTGVPIAARAALFGKVTGAGDTPVLVDTFGNALVRQAAPASGATIGTLTAAGQSVTCTTAVGYQEAIFTLSGTYAVFQGGFELSDDGTNWFFAPTVQTISVGGPLYRNNASSTNFVANSTTMFRVPTFGLGQVRLRAAGGPATGACNVRITLVPFGTPHGAASLASVLGTTALTLTNATSSSPVGFNDPAAGSAGILAGVTPFLYAAIGNNTFDAARGMERITTLASAARVATTSAALINVQNCALMLAIDVTARASATTLTPSLLMGSTAVGFVANKTVWTAAAAINTSSGTTMYVFWPFPTNATPTGLAELVNLPIFRDMTLTVTHNDANSITYSAIIFTAAVG